MTARVMLTSLVVLVVIAGSLVVLVRVAEPRLAFFPTAGETTTPAQFGLGYEGVALETSDGERLRAWRVDVPSPRARIVYFHGNGGNLSVWAPILAGIARRGYSVLAVDYRGYGLSSGRPSEQGLYRDVDAVIASDQPRETSIPLVYWGRSLGTTMAGYAATRRAPDGLILESGFPDVGSLVRSTPPLAFLALFSSYRFPTASYLRQVTSPVLVMHGDRDEVIPFGLGRALYDRAREPRRFFTIAGANHNDADPPDPQAYWAAVADFISSLRPAT